MTLASASFIVPIVDEMLTKAFAAAHLNLAAICVASADAFCERIAAVHQDAQHMSQRAHTAASKKIKQIFDNVLTRSRRDAASLRKKRYALALEERQSAQSTLNVILCYEKQRCIREWSCLALTSLIYNIYIKQSTDRMLSEVSLAEMDVFLRDLVRKLSPAIAAKHCSLSDISAPFCCALLRRHKVFLPCVMQTDQEVLLRESRFLTAKISPAEFRRKHAGKPHEASKQIQRASLKCIEANLTSDQVSKQGQRMETYGAVCCSDLSHFVSGMANPADRFNLSPENLMVLWRCYLFAVLQRGAVPIQDNAYSAHTRAQTNLFAQYVPLRASLLALRTRIDTAVDEWRRERVFFCSRELRDMWVLRCNCLLQGLDVANFAHRMVRQEMAQRLATHIVLSRAEDAMKERAEEKRKTTLSRTSIDNGGKGKLLNN